LARVRRRASDGKEEVLKLELELYCVNNSNWILFSAMPFKIDDGVLWIRGGD
jgi:hypothetical protein